MQRRPTATLLSIGAKPGTDKGVIVGTVSYMSPEQAEGRPVDGRSDIFSFGAVLYEMVTGRKAFQGDTRLSTLSAILRDEPKSASQIVRDVPKELERVLARCLRKDAGRRFQHMADVKVALEELKEESESARLPTASLAQHDARGAWRRRLIWAGGLLSVLVVAALTVWFLRTSARSPATDLTAVPLTTYPGSEDSPSFSPDGTQVAFSWNGGSGDNLDIYLKLVGPGPPPLRLTSHAANDSNPAWSPDGRFIAFKRSLPGGRNLVQLIAPTGGPERTVGVGQVSPIQRIPSSIAWTPDGRSLLIIHQDGPDRPEGVFLLPLDGHEKRRLTSPPPGQWDAFPALSPDGRTLVFSRGNGIFMVPLSSDLRPQGAPKTIMSDTVADGLAWTVDGRDVIAGTVSNSGGGTRNLWRIAADGSRAPQRLSVGNECGSPAVSAQGGLAYACTTTDSNVWRLDLDRAAAAPVRLISSTWQDHSGQFSPDGTKIAFYSTRSGNPEIWVCNRDGTNAVQVTSLGGPPLGTPRWSPDGERIVFDSSLNRGQWGIYVVAASGGRPVALTDASSFNAIPSWSHDGKQIYFCSDRGGTREIWRMPAQGGEAVQVTHKGALAALESANGEFVYYTKSDEGTEGLWKAAVEGGEETQVLDSVVPNRGFAVADDGIYFVTGTAPYTLRFLSFRTGRQRTLAKLDDHIIYLNLSPDGKSILYTQNERAGSDLMLVEHFR